MSDTAETAPTKVRHEERGYFSRVGSVHLHIDGVDRREKISGLLSDSVSANPKWEKLPVKINAVTNSIDGPQRVAPEFIKTYDAHNPKTHEKSKLDYFATIDLSSGVDLSNGGKDERNFSRVKKSAKEFINYILPISMARHPGTVVEVERVIGKLGDSDNNGFILFDETHNFQKNDSAFELKETKPIEIHHAIDIPKKSESPAINVSLLNDVCDDLGIIVGGWFEFERDGYKSFRSNVFLDKDYYEAIAKEEYNKMNEYIKKNYEGYRFKTIVEQILGIWAPRTSR